MFTGFCLAYLILSLLAALGCFLTFLYGLHRNTDETSAILLAAAIVTPISGFVLYGFSKLAVDVANDIRLMRNRKES
jgi:hypothetical protein